MTRVKRVSTGTAARLLDVSQKVVRRMIASGELDGWRPKHAGAEWRVSLASVRRVLVAQGAQGTTGTRKRRQG